MANEITSPSDKHEVYAPNVPFNLRVSGHFDPRPEGDIILEQNIQINTTKQKLGTNFDGDFSVIIEVSKSGPFGITATFSGKWKDGDTTFTWNESITISITVVLDSTSPVLRIESPVEGGSVPIRGTMDRFELRVRAADRDSGIEPTSFRWYLNNRTSDENISRFFTQNTADPALWSTFVDWPADFQVPGDHSITVRAGDKAGNWSEWTTVHFKAADVMPPTCTIERPSSDTKFSWLGVNQTTIEVVGTATDTQSGVASVTCQLLNRAGQKVGQEVVHRVDAAQAGTVNWKLSLPVMARGWYSLSCTVRDRATSPNEVTKTVDKLEVAEAFKPSDINNLVGFRQYLLDLLKFIREHFGKTQQGNNPPIPLTEDDLKNVFYQDFEGLAADPTSAKAGRPDNQARLCIETLRGYLQSLVDPDTYKSINIGGYTRTAYETLLQQFGTSYEELRLARGSDEDTRLVLAVRLGIDRDPQWSHHLDQLLLEPDDITESNLETLFGLRNSTRSPLDEQPVPALLSWQLSQLQTMWIEQDRALVELIMDPDVVGIEDRSNPDPRDPVSRLWVERIKDIYSLSYRLQERRTAGPTPLAGLTAMIDFVMKDIILAVTTNPQLPSTPCKDKGTKPIEFLQCLDEEQRKGTNIQPILDAIPLELSALRQLIRILQLAKVATPIVTEAEWDSISHILTRVWKGSRRESWRKEETGLSISPQFFKLYRGEPPFLPHTGVKAGVLLPEGVEDPEWDLLDAPTGSSYNKVYVSEQQPQHWLANTDRSHWVSPTPHGSEAVAPGVYVYRTVLPLDGWDITTLQVVATIAVDSRLTGISVNGQGVFTESQLAKVGPRTFTAIDLTGSLSGGAFISFAVMNDSSQPKPSGLRVEFSFAAPPRRIQLPRWRIPATTRTQWQASLQARIDQEEGLRQAFAKAIQATEELTLPLLRDTLIKKVGTVVGMAPATAADWLSERLFIETKGTGWRLTTRMQQAIETLQALVFSLRTQRFAEDHPAKQWSRINNESENEFDDDWQMAGSYETWRAASLIFYYPENLLLPTLRQPDQITAPFRQLVQTLRARSRVTPELARRLAREYLDSVRGFGKLAHWPCDQGPDTQLLVDQSSNANNGKMNSGQFISDGRFNGAITFNGTNYAEVSHSGSLELGKDGADFTVSFWFRLAQDHTGSWRCIMHKGKSTYQRTFALWMVPSDNRIHFRISTDQEFNSGGNSSTELTLNAWHHIAYVKTGTELRLHINGKLDASASLTGTVIGNDGPIYLGGDPWHPGILGSVDDIRIYNYALTEVMIQNLAATGETTPAELNPPFILTDQRTEDELKQLRKTAETVLSEFPKVAPPELLEIFYFVPMTLALQLQNSGEYTAALDWFQTVYAYNLSPDERKIYPGLRKETNGPVALSRTEHWMREFLNPHLLATQRAYPPKETDPRSNPYTRYTLMSIARCFIEFADAEFTNDTGESLTRARSLYLTARRILTDSDLDQVQPTKKEETLLPNPILDALRKRIDTQLTKMQQGRNIAGMKREIEVPTPPKTMVGLPTIGSGGQLVIPGARRRQKPTPYRFTVLMERAKQLVSIAQQIEATYLSALEKRDSENYNLKRAGFDLQLAEAGNTLQTLRETEAMDSEALVIQQKAKASKQKETYRKWIDNGLSATEEAIIRNYITAGSAQIASIWFSVGLAVAQAQAAASPATTTASVGVAAVTATGVLSALKSGADSVAIGAKTAAEVLSIKASHERRVNDWQLAYDLADIEEKIADQQAIVAKDHTNIVRQEKAIAQLQTTQATAMANYLANKFTNAELYEWMSGVLAGVYSYFLQQATGVAMLAESQLTFERQEAPTSFIQNDYWEAPADGATANPNEKGKDRRGLTGSARLLQDIYQLDQYAFEANKRKLNLTHTLSLATLDPYAFAVFRETGVLNFQTPMRIFDEAFPGDYLRLIKRVRTSVVALIPPVVGIRATLTTSGVSRVVIGGDVFQETTIRRDPELVALSSPVNATGVFELDAQSELLMPFESMGVDTRWEFSMPRASNPFDFQTIADILVTIEYTALFSVEYRQQVIQNLDLRVSADKAFSIRNEFPDIWYDLVNSEKGASESPIRFRAERSYFPPNLEENITIGDLLFAILSGKEELDISGDVKLSYTPDIPKNLQPIPVDRQPVKEATATILERRIHTRLPGGRSSWGAIQGKHATGAWEFTLPTSVLTPIRKGDVDDILIVLTFNGTKPSWPT
ncbi:MAG: LamG-like jellyroll fold domain-containing protein [Nitrospira sp.]